MKWKNLYKYYRVSDCGVIQTRAPVGRYAKDSPLKAWRGKKVSFGKTDYTGAGYLSVVLYVDDGKKKSVKLHRIVAELFCDRPIGCNEVDHIDGDRFNNRASNLRWVTHAQNMRFAKERGALKGNRSRWNRTRGLLNGAINKENALAIYDRIKSGESNSSISRSLGINQSGVSNFRLGKKNFHLFYKETGLPIIKSKYGTRKK